MDKNEFLAFMAFSNACALDSHNPKDYGFKSWEDAYRCVKHCKAAKYQAEESVQPFILIEEMEYSFWLGEALKKAYVEAAFVLGQASFYKVRYED